MANKTCTKLPARSTIQERNISCLHLAQEQIGEQFSKTEHTTLYSDETSKYGDKFKGYHATDFEINYWVLGMRDISTEASENTLATFKENLEDITNAAEECQTEAGKHILGNIKKNYVRPGGNRIEMVSSSCGVQHTNITRSESWMGNLDHRGEGICVCSIIILLWSS